ncbi:alpha/beta hydrolase fold domain-containing protein [Nocardia sp. ET3-3]|uniref:Alpha/beta hydrolase fold domain-containing protein n=1 Tax=Nocardia terrae TaxID=2675851 RepID=A0A7K1UNA5_9NOCA|nr:alpha/beta hydrolase [Nocardia terrae]MVU75801.1 alpha/beta hydrolase fold domain-containing protein [Nocardia terrae]
MNTRSTATFPFPAVPTRASARTRFAAAASVVGLRQVNGLLPNNRIGIEAGRGLIAGIMAAFGPTLPGTAVMPVRSGAVHGEWVRAAGVRQGDRAIYYLHGSGYVVCSARTHRGLASRLSKATGLPVFVVDYRLAPEHPFPAAAEDAAAGYRWLLEHGYRASDLVIGGDSAGCHLTLDLLLQNAIADVEQPAGAFMFSPLMDPTLTLAERCDRMLPDPMAPARVGRRLIELYTAAEPEDSPRLRLRIPSGVTLPPLFVQASAGEMLADDARHLRDMAAAAGVACELELWPGRIHVFQALPLLVPEAAAALRRAASFVTSTLAHADSPARKQVS